MKKICFVTTIYLTYKSFLKGFSRYLHETGEYEISLICNDEENIREDLPDFVHYYPVNMKRGVSLSAFSAIKSINRILKENEFDIVQYSTPNAAFYTSIAAKKAKIPVRLYCQWGIRYMGFEGIKRGLFKLLEKITCDNSTFIEAESHNIRNFSLEEKLYKESNSSVIWNGSASGVNLEKFDISKKEIWRKEIRDKYGINDNDIVFSFAARLTGDKGINELLEAFLQLECKYNDIKLLVSGGMDDKGSLISHLYEKAQNSDKVVFTGSVRDIERYYAAADVFVSPSYREGFGLVVIEAESMGLPAIVTDVPGQIDAIIPQKTGLSCKVKDSQSLAQAMEKLINDKEFRAQLAVAAVNFAVENFNDSELFKRLKDNRDSLICGG